MQEEDEEEAEEDDLPPLAHQYHPSGCRILGKPKQK
jgi:hypothetical protein